MWLIHEVLQLLTKGYIAATVLKGAGKVWHVKEQMNKGEISNLSRLSQPTCPRNVREIQTDKFCWEI